MDTLSKKGVEIKGITDQNYSNSGFFTMSCKIIRAIKTFNSFQASSAKGLAFLWVLIYSFANRFISVQIIFMISLLIKLSKSYKNCNFLQIVLSTNITHNIKRKASRNVVWINLLLLTSCFNAVNIQLPNSASIFSDLLLLPRLSRSLTNSSPLLIFNNIYSKNNK